ncbi:MAG: alginate lyase family protein [Vicinamibacterales bacterium]
MRGPELRWRARAALRNTADRARGAVHTPRWNRSDLAHLIEPTGPCARARGAALRGDWSRAGRELACAIAGGTAFALDVTTRRELRHQIRARFPGAATDAAAAADRILAGELDLLGYRALSFATPHGAPDWHWDPVHRRRAPLRFWTQVPYLDPAVGDHKVIWELNRQQHLLVLGRAYWLTGDARYRSRALADIAGWLDANPPLLGINWASMLELAFRALSWTWAMHFFVDPIQDDTDSGDNVWLVDLVVALDRHLLQIARNLSYYFSPNTHLLGEALALYVVGSAFPWLSRASMYAATGRQILLDEARRQIADDGGHVERSTHYHRYTLDFYLLALVSARLSSDPATTGFASAVSRLADAACALAGDTGLVPHIGDDDGGMLLPMCGLAPDNVAVSLGVASLLTQRPELQMSALAEETFWWLGDRRLRPLIDGAAAGPPIRSHVVSTALPCTGYFISRVARGHHLVVDAGPHGFANGGHSHADALSLTLDVDGLPLFIDPGTASYTADEAARTCFRSTHLHNTLVVDDLPQSIPDGPFHWRRTANAVAHLWHTDRDFDALEASHDGYGPVEHRRWIFVRHGDLLVVADLVHDTGAADPAQGPRNVGGATGRARDVHAHWHLAPRWHAAVGGRRAVLRERSREYVLAVSAGRLEAFTASAEPRLGWHSPAYGVVEPTTTLRASLRGALPVWLVTALAFDTANAVVAIEHLDVQTAVDDGPAAFAARITRAQSVDYLGVRPPAWPRAGASAPGGSDRRGVWRLGPYETDARLFFYSERGEATCAAAGGTARKVRSACVA